MAVQMIAHPSRSRASLQHGRCGIAWPMPATADMAMTGIASSVVAPIVGRLKGLRTTAST